MGSTTLKYERDGGTFFVDFPKTLGAGRTYSIDVHYSGNPTETGRFGCFTFKQDTAGHPWINTACEETGALPGGVMGTTKPAQASSDPRGSPPGYSSLPPGSSGPW